MSDKPKYEAFTTPAGEAVYPWLNKADVKHDPDGAYKVDVSVPFDIAQPLIAKLEKIRNDFIATLPAAKQRALTPKPVFIEEYTRPEYPKDSTKEQRAAIKDAFEGEPTGNVIFRCKMKARVSLPNGDSFDHPFGNDFFARPTKKLVFNRRASTIQSQDIH